MLGFLDNKLSCKQNLVILRLGSLQMLKQMKTVEKNVSIVRAFGFLLMDLSNNIHESKISDVIDNYYSPDCCGDT